MIKEYLILDKETQKRISNDQSNQNDSSYIQDNDYDYSTNLPKKKTIKQEDQVCLLKNKQAVQYQRSMEDLNYNFGKKRKLQSYRNVNNKENQKRQDNSLSILTRRFMKQIRSESDQTIDLNQVSIALGVQKRRIYDITNVLEGELQTVISNFNQLQSIENWLEYFLFNMKRNKLYQKSIEEQTQVDRAIKLRRKGQQNYC